jgi:uncharacterized protein (TIRG00374 family)
VRTRILIGLLCSLTFIALLLNGVNMNELGQHMLAVKPIYILPAIAAYFTGIWVRALRWQILLKDIVSVPIMRLFNVELIGFGVNNVMPVRLGEIVRVWLLTRSHGARPAATLGSIVVERVLDGLFLCLVLLTGLLTLHLDEWLRQGVIITAALFGIGTACIFIAALAPGLVDRLLVFGLRFTPLHLREMLLEHARSFLVAFAPLRKLSALPIILLLTAVGWLSEGAIYWFLLQGFAIPAGFSAAMLGMSAANLATIIPSSPGYVGTFHFPLQAVLVSGFGVDPSEAAAYAIVTHALIVLPIAALGVLLLAREGLSLSSVQERASQFRQELRRGSGDAAPPDVVATKP